MGLDYYSALGLTRSATDTDVKKSYRKLALKYHPDKDSSEDARSEFVRVCEAYDVLSDQTESGQQHEQGRCGRVFEITAKRKGFYDLHGEEALKYGKPDGQGGVKGAIYNFDESECTRIFARFFGTNNPYEALEDLTNTFQAITATHQPKAGKMQVHPVELTLEEVFHGCLKKVTFQRRRITADNQMVVEDQVLAIDVKPGLPEGTRFVFEGEGNVFPGTTPGAVVFVLKTLKHERFERRGADLVYSPVIPLFHALAGTAIKVQMLDGKIADIPFAEIVTPGYECSLPGLGLPDPASGPACRGKLIVKTQLLFPKSLSQTQKLLLQAALFLPEEKEGSDVVKSFLRGFEDPLNGWLTGVRD